MNREEVFTVLKSNILAVLTDTDESRLQEEVTLLELGANSLDRMDIVLNTAQDLNLRIPTRDLVAPATLGSLTDLLLVACESP